MIFYGLLTNTSVPKLYLAGFVPGLMLAGLFMVTVMIARLFRPAWGGRRIASSWRDPITSLPDLVPPMLIFLAVVGSIYAGLATHTIIGSMPFVIAMLVMIAALVAWPQIALWLPSRFG